MRATFPGLSLAQLFRCSDKWSVVELGLQGVTLPITPPKTPSKDVGSSREQFSSTPPKHRSRSVRARREHSYDTPERQQGDTIKSRTPMSIDSPVHSQDTDLDDFATLCYADGPKLIDRITTPTRPRGVLQSHSPRQHTGGRLGQVVRNFVKRMLPPPSGGGRSTTYGRARQAGSAKGAGEDSPSGRTWRAEMTPRSDVSGESRWTFASAGSWEGCMEYQTTNRWSGFWH